MEYRLAGIPDGAAERASLAYSDISSASDATLNGSPRPSLAAECSADTEYSSSHGYVCHEEDEDVELGGQPGTVPERIRRSLRATLPFMVSVAAILIFVPVLRFISSTSGSFSLSEAVPSSPSGGVNALFPHQPPPDQADVETATLPFFSNPNSGPLGTPYMPQPDFSSSSIDAQGNWGLANAQPFGQVERLFPGWSTPAESKKTNDPTASASLSPPSQLRQITMEAIFNGTFTPKTAEINWTKEGM